MSGGLCGGRGPYIVGFSWAGAGIATILIALRAVYASKTAGRWRPDFILAVLSLISCIIAGVFITLATTQGLGNHMADIAASFANPLDAIKVFESMLFWNAWAIPIGIIGMTLSKLSVVALLLKTLGAHKIDSTRHWLWAVAALISFANLLQIFAAIFQCNPVAKAYTLALEGNCDGAVLAEKVGYFQAAVSGGTDIALAVWPIVMVSKMNMNKNAKIAFAVFMSVGSLTSIPSFIRVSVTSTILNAADKTYDGGLYWIWIIIEAWALIIIPSIVTLRPLWSILFPSITFVANKPRSSEKQTPLAGSSTVSRKRSEGRSPDDLEDLRFMTDLEPPQRVMSIDSLNKKPAFVAARPVSDHDFDFELPIQRN